MFHLPFSIFKQFFWNFSFFVLFYFLLPFLFFFIINLNDFLSIVICFATIGVGSTSFFVNCNAKTSLPMFSSTLESPSCHANTSTFWLIDLCIIYFPLFFFWFTIIAWIFTIGHSSIKCVMFFLELVSSSSFITNIS